MTSFEDYLSNWVRWHARHRSLGRCGSLEGGWRSKQYWDAPPVTPLGKVDQLAAQLVEAAWVTLDTVPKLMLKWHYIYCRTPGAIARSLRQRGWNIAPKDYSLILFHARESLSKAIAIQKKTLDNPRIAVVCVSLPRWEADAPTGQRAA